MDWEKRGKLFRNSILSLQQSGSIGNNLVADLKFANYNTYFEFLVVQYSWNL